MLDENIIKPAQTEWASPIVFAPKEDENLRFCHDYRKLNAVTKQNAYLIPRLDKCIDSLGEASFFSTLDANSGCWQTEIDEADRNKTAFTSHHEIYRFIRMPFRLRNAPGTFQRTMDFILSTVKWRFALVYFDDIAVFSKSPEEYIEHVRHVFTLLSDAAITLKLKKRCFFTDTIDYLGGLIIRPRQLEIAPNTTVAIRGLEPPTSLTELRLFLGMCKEFRRFVPNFARIAAPLKKRLRKDQYPGYAPLSAEELTALHALMDALISPAVLALPYAGGHITLDTDTCDVQVGNILLLKQPNDSVRPTGYCSRSLNDAERRYDTTQRECFAIVWSFLLLGLNLGGNRFSIRTDHDSLEWILNLADSSGRLARWRRRLSEFDFEVVH